jgi:catechol 2,3-dioxygenase-like lactoylglutathione lyase family enzyme
MHHVSIRTANIHRALPFYETLGYRVAERFTAGMTLACWLEGFGGRLELIEVPQPVHCPDPFGDEGYVGYYHLSLELSPERLAGAANLGEWLTALGDRLEAADAGPLKILLAPRQQAIAATIYEVAFIADRDGLPIELLRVLGTNPHLRDESP